ncbi:MAG TPA: hypothetical protein PKI20_19805 [Verrucomicrobiota bacterium]|jgi:hypothetical protein|nr:hypothetical protein [Verrucomicrobiota bacterium]
MKPILDRSGSVIGYENDVSEYRKEIRSASNSLLGHYNPKLNKTFDRTGSVVSNAGDVRSSLIRPDKEN